MKRLYLIMIVLLLSACARGEVAVREERLQATIPPAWLTRPPTPELAPASDVTAKNAARTPDAASILTDAEAEQVIQPSPSPEPLFRLPRLFGRQWTISAEPGVPPELTAAARGMAAERPDDFLWIEPGSLPTDITLTIGGQEPLAHWTYVVAAPFATLEDEVTRADLSELWSESGAVNRELLIGKGDSASLQTILGPARADLQLVDGPVLEETLWARRPSLTIVPFHFLSPELKVLRLEGQSPLDKDFDLEAYPLRMRVGVDGEQEALAAFFGAWKGPSSNFDPSRLTHVAMTGVTALVRATATQMEIDGILAPAVDVGPILRSVDIAHISNEVSFAADCPEPSPVGGTSFCSQDEYFALLQDIGTDVVELTGNHLNDYGADNLLRTINIYEEAGMDYFGGGRDAADAQRAAIVEHHGNRIAFVGCNYFGPAYAWATDFTAGSRACDATFLDQIAELESQGHLVIATQQFTEYYQYAPTPDQEIEFRAIADAGAAAVSGSQGHHAQGFDLHNGAFIHYGLGNLFFDQMDMLGTRQAFVDIYSIYEGRLINVELWTGLIENYFLPRKMAEAERREALEAVFQASGW